MSEKPKGSQQEKFFKGLNSCMLGCALSILGFIALVLYALAQTGGK